MLCEVLRMKRSALITFLALLVAFAANPLTVRADLAGDIKSILADKYLAKCDVGIEVIHLGSTAQQSPVIFNHNSDAALIPASNLKLVTTAAALNGLGADFKFRTLLVSHGKDLILIGDGDPTLG